MSRLLTRYKDGLIDPEVRLIGTHKGVAWVSDRYVMVRADMWKRPVTPKGAHMPSADIPTKALRKTLAGVPRNVQGCRITDLRITNASGHTLAFVSRGTALTPIDASILPLLRACDSLVAFEDGRKVAGFQKRPRSAQPVLVCVVMGVRFVSGEYVEVAP